jgi:hypothetical protein
MEMEFKIADRLTFGFSAGGSKPAASDGVAVGDSIIIEGSYGKFLINENAVFGQADREE